MARHSVFSDIDECTDPNICIPQADCSNTAGSYQCQCKPGYTGNGTVCTGNAVFFVVVFPIRPHQRIATNLSKATTVYRTHKI